MRGSIWFDGRVLALHAKNPGSDLYLPKQMRPTEGVKREERTLLGGE